MAKAKPRTMRVAGIFGIPFDIRTIEMETPNAPPDGIVLKVAACGLCNSEVKMARRGHPMLEKFPLPLIAGHEFSGEVIEVGDEVEGLAVGERIVIMGLVPCGYCPQCRRGRSNICDNAFRNILVPGGFAPYVMVAGHDLPKRVFPIPENVSYEEAALSEPIACVINGIERANILPGDTVTILGVGFMGLMLTSLASSGGAGKLIAVDQVDERLELAREMGATHTINFSKEDPIQVIQKITDQSLANVVIEATGNPIAYEQAFRVVGKGGRVVYFGGVPSNSIIELDPNKIHYQEVEITGAANPKPIHVTRALEFLSTGKLNVKRLITHHIPALELKEAMAKADAREAIKIMLTHD